MKNNVTTRRFPGLACGIIIALIGAYMLGISAGLIPENLLDEVPIFPLAMLGFGAFIMYNSITRKDRREGSGRDSDTCC